MTTIGITGSTGHVGGMVARQLADVAPTLIVRDPDRAPDIPGATVRVADYADRGACADAFAGVDVLFLVSGAEHADRRQHHRNAIGAAAEAGVTHLVYTSFAGAAPDAIFTLGRDHADAEAAIRESGLPATILRDNFYADLLPWFADSEGVIRGPAGEGRVAAVARADVADVAAAVLRDPAAHAGAVYELSGPEALTMAEIADRAGAVIGKELRYVAETVDEARASRAHLDPEPFEMDAWISTYTAIAAGEVSRVTDHVERVAGHPARTIEEALE
ncbi:SDR family oxidoreductase [Euzebya sp.]|uniref:SDR family oxidoreductase n=1 Tax=Euzebya sp. TaxID=1971409 RepID=UPI0035164C5C